MNTLESIKCSGFFISLEGIDGAGKSTHLEFIADIFRKKQLPVVVTREPGGTEFGRLMRQLLLDEQSFELHQDTELLLFFCDRVQHYHKLIKPALEAGKIVISDRFTDSTYAYQGGETTSSKINTRIKRLQKWALADFQPDLTLLFDIDPAQSAKRSCEDLKSDRLEKKNKNKLSSTELFEDVEFDKVRKRYLALAKRTPERIKIIQAGDSLGKVQENILQRLKEKELC